MYFKDMSLDGWSCTRQMIDLTSCRRFYLANKTVYCVQILKRASQPPASLYSFIASRYSLALQPRNLLSNALQRLQYTT